MALKLMLVAFPSHFPVQDKSRAFSSHSTHFPSGLSEVSSFPTKHMRFFYTVSYPSQRHCNVRDARPSRAFSYVTIEASTVGLRLGTGTVQLAFDIFLIPVRRKRPMEYSPQDSARDSCSEKRVKQYSGPHATAHAFLPDPDVICRSAHFIYIHLSHLAPGEDR